MAMPSAGAPPAEAARKPIGVFDSGLGGLSIVRALIDLVPGRDLVYFGDTGRFPYGPKQADEVAKFAAQITQLLLERDVGMVVVACNTAAAVALEDLQGRVDVPVVGVIEPGIRAARRATTTGRVGVIGTVGTVRSGAYQRAVTRIAPELDVVVCACPGFVEFVEAGDTDSDQVHVLAERMLAPLRAAAVDTLVLGCTHYPMLARTIGDVMGRDVVLVSSAEETAFEVDRLLAGCGGTAIPNDTDMVGRHTFVTSGDVERFRRLGARFCGPEVEHVEAFHW
jgi:glutamate racemase